MENFIWNYFAEASVKIEVSSGEKKEILSRHEKLLLSRIVQSFLEGKKGIDEVEIKIHKEVPELQIPLSIFSSRLGILEAAVKYLREDLDMDSKEIGFALKKSLGNIAVSYNKSKKKMPNLLEISGAEGSVPASIFSKDSTCFESIAVYLRDERKMSFVDIGRMLGRDRRTVWTVYKRARGELKW